MKTKKTPKTKSKKINAELDSEILRKRVFTRKYQKSIRFNKKEIDLIDSYCNKFGVKSKSSFFRDCIIDNIMEQLDENYPKLF